MHFYCVPALCCMHFYCIPALFACISNVFQHCFACISIVFQHFFACISIVFQHFLRSFLLCSSIFCVHFYCVPAFLLRAFLLCSSIFFALKHVEIITPEIILNPGNIYIGFCCRWFQGRRRLSRVRRLPGRPRKRQRKLVRMSWERKRDFSGVALQTRSIGIAKRKHR